MTKQRYFSNFENYLSIFGHRLQCTKPESSRLQNIVVDSGLRLPDSDTGWRRTEPVSDCCLCRQKYSVIDKAVDEWQCVLCQGMTRWTLPLLTRRETFVCTHPTCPPGFFINLFLYFLQVPHKFCCAPRAPVVRNLGGGHVRPPALLRRRLCSQPLCAKNEK